MKIPDDKSESSGSSFKLNTDDRGFASRSNDIFAGLDHAESKHTDFVGRLQTSGLNRSCQKSDPIIAPEEINRRARGRFKRPFPRNNRGSKRSREPDYRLHPNKWKKYSLADVSDVSESSNKSAAFAFLKDLKSRKTSDKPSDELDSGMKETEKSIVFHKPKLLDDSCGTSQKPCYVKSSALRMPEYIIGQKSQKKQKTDKKHSEKSDTTSGCAPSFELNDESNDIESDDKQESSKTEVVTFKKKGKKLNRCFRKKDDEDN